MTIGDFKKRNTFEQRCTESAQVREKYKNKVAVIAEMSKKALEDGKVSDIDKAKYLVPSDLTVGQLTYVIRGRIKLAPEMAIFCFVGGEDVIPPTFRTVASLYDEYKDEDGFLYITFGPENTFGTFA